jgi:hypothetical protein
MESSAFDFILANFVYFEISDMPRTTFGNQYNAARVLWISVGDFK